MARHFFLRALLLVLIFSPDFSAHSQQASQNSSPSTLSSAYAQKIEIDGVRNAGKINDRFLRGAQPSAPGLAALKKLGITMVVSLRSESKTVAWEKQQAAAQGLHFLNIPVGGFSAPADQQVVQFLSLFLKNPDEKIFVHCRYGEDRTGVFVASYRMAIDKWPADQAIREMYLFGFNAKWQPHMKDFARDFPSRLTMAPAYAPLKVMPSPLPAERPR